MQAINQNADCAVKSAECSVLNIMCSEHCVICTVSTNVKICLMQPRQCTECNAMPFVEQVVRKIFKKIVLNWEVGRSTASFSISAFSNLCSFTFLGVAQIEGNFLQKNEFKAWSRRRHPLIFTSLRLHYLSLQRNLLLLIKLHFTKLFFCCNK